MPSIYANINSQGVDLKSVMNIPSQGSNLGSMISIGKNFYSIGDLVLYPSIYSPAERFGGTGIQLSGTSFYVNDYSGYFYAGQSTTSSNTNSYFIKAVGAANSVGGNTNYYGTTVYYSYGVSITNNSVYSGQSSTTGLTFKKATSNLGYIPQGAPLYFLKTQVSSNTCSLSITLACYGYSSNNYSGTIEFVHVLPFKYIISSNNNYYYPVITPEVYNTYSAGHSEGIGLYYGYNNIYCSKPEFTAKTYSVSYSTRTMYLSGFRKTAD